MTTRIQYEPRQMWLVLFYQYDGNGNRTAVQRSVYGSGEQSDSAELWGYGGKAPKGNIRDWQIYKLPVHKDKHRLLKIYNLKEDKLMGLLPNNSKTQEIDTPIIKVKNNVIEFKDYIIQISNIADAEIAPVPKQVYPTWTIIVAILGIIAFVEGIVDFGFTMAIFGLIATVLCIFVLYNVYKKNQVRGEVLILTLNSGKAFYFKCRDHEFLRRVLNAIKVCINTKDQSIVIDLSNSKIENSPIVPGDSNVIEVGA